MMTMSRARGRHTISPARSRGKRYAAMLAAGALAAGGLTVPMTPVLAASVPVTGTVFIDYAGDGSYTTSGSTIDAPLPGVTVTAYDPSGGQVGQTISGADGTYSLGVSSGDGVPLRIEFTGIPGDTYDTFNASASSVQFTVAGSGTALNHGVFDPAAYLPSTLTPEEVPVFTAIQWAGLTSGDTAGETAIAGTDWVVPGNAGNSATKFNNRTDLATYGQVGNVWGLAHNIPQNALYAAASYKRFGGVGPLGIGGIYRIDDVVDTDGTRATGGTSVTQWLDVSSIGINVGTVPSDAARGLTASSGTAITDIDGFQQAGKVGIGGLAISPDGRYLFLVNLHDKNLYVINVPANGSAPTSGDVTMVPLNLGANQRPWAVEVHRGQVYVGYVDTGSVPGASASSEGMNAYVVSAPVSSVVAGNSPSTVVLTAPLGYRKGNSASAWGGSGSPAGQWGTSQMMQIVRWNSWVDEWSWGTADACMTNTGVGDIASGVATTVGLCSTTGWGQLIHMYPQPILSGITFDSNGYMSLGLLDRTSVQSGNRNLPAMTGVTNQFFETLSSGDLLMAAPAGDGTYTLENDGAAGSRTSITPASNVQGPPDTTSREFYNDNQNAPINKNAQQNHQDPSLGAVVAHPSLSQIAATAFDPLTGIRLSGVNWFNSTNGDGIRGYEHNRDDNLEQGSRGFQKGGGMGDLTVLIKAAPVQIGNRTWLDLDGDGVQDAGEPAIAGVVVELWKNGTYLGQTTTDSEGNYFFRSEDGVDGTPGFTRDGEYEVRFVPATSGSLSLNWLGATEPAGFVAPDWSDLSFTQQEADDATADERRRGSNPDSNGVAPVTVGGPGANDHTIDAGWTFQTYAVGDYIWIDTNYNGSQDDGEEPFTEGTQVRLWKLYPDSAGALAGQRIPGSDRVTTTDANGYYFFDMLFGGDYEIEFELPEGYFWTQHEETDDIEKDSNAGHTDEFQQWATTGKLTLGNAMVDPDYDLQDGWVASEGLDPTWDAGITKVPSGTVNKSDELGNDANDPADAVDVGPQGGEIGIVFTIENTSDEPITEIGLVDVSTGSGTVNYPMACVSSEGEEFTLANSADRWNSSTLSPGETITCEATLSGVAAGEPHGNLVTLYAEGDFTGKPVVKDPKNPGTPDNPNRPTDPYNAEFLTFAIGDLVWIDVDNDGVQEASDLVFTAGTEVRLWQLDADGNRVGTDPIATTTTDADGYYLFDNLTAGDYEVEFKLPSGYFWTQYVQGGDDTVDSNAGHSTIYDEWATTGPITLGNSSVDPDYDLQDGWEASEGVDPRWDGGITRIPTGTVNKSDADGNDANDENDAVDLGPTGGEIGIVFTIENTSTEPITNIGLVDATLVGDGEVSYPLSCVAPGDVEFELATSAARWTGELAPGESITCEATLSGVVAGVLHTNLVTLYADGALSGRPVVEDPENPGTPDEPNRPNDPYNAGVLTYALGDLVWIDVDNNGVQDASDLAFTAGTGVRLWQLDEKGERVGTDPIATTTTDGNGYYFFDDLPAGDYEVEFELPAGYVWTKYLQGDDDTVDSNAGYTTIYDDWATTGKITLGNSSVDPEYDLQDGWEATEGLDPRWDGGITAIPSGTVNKSDENGNDANTTAEAVDLGPSGGEVGIVITIANTSTEPLVNIGLVDLTTAGSGDVQYPMSCTPSAGAPFELLSAGARWAGPLPVGGTISCDATLTGVVAHEPHTNVVTLWAEGALTGLPVQDPENPGTDPQNPNRPNDPYNAEVLTYAIGDLVWIDTNNNGIQDPSESPFAEGTQVRLWQLDDEGNRVGTDPIATTTTDGNGYYFFDELPAGKYEVEFELPDGYLWTKSTQGADPEVDSNATHTTIYDQWATTGVIELGNGAVDPEYDLQEGWDATEGLDPTWDAGITRIPSGDVVKKDERGNDANTTDEAVDLGPDGGAIGIVITIENTSDEPLTTIGLVDATTAGSGTVQYPIECVAPGDVEFTLADASARWTGELAPGEEISCTAELTGVVAHQPHTNVVTLWADGVFTGLPVEDPENPSKDPQNPNRPNDPYNAEVLTYAIGDVVWIDVDNDGVQDPEEPTFTGGTEVRLWQLDHEGNRVGTDPIAVTTIDENGFYFFDELPAGDYEVEFKLPPGFFWTKPTQGSDPGADSNAGHTSALQEWASTGKITVGNDAIDPEYDLQDGWDATEGLDPTWDAGITRIPTGTVTKDDTEGRDGNDPAAPADLTEADGTIGIVFTIANTSDEPLTNIGLADVTTAGSGTVNYPLACTAPGGVTFELADADARWSGELAVGASLTCEGTLTGVVAGEDHTNVVTLWAEGVFTGRPVEDPENPSGDPENPNRPVDPYTGKVTPQPKAVIVKDDANGKDGDFAEFPVNLTEEQGTVGLVYTITNTGNEALRDVVVTDEVTQGDATVTAMECAFPGNASPTAGVQDAAGNWTVTWAETTGDHPASTFPRDASFTCSATLAGVGEWHQNVAEIDGTGVVSGEPIERKPFTPGDDEPGTDNPYNATVDPKVPGPEAVILKDDTDRNKGDFAGSPVDLTAKLGSTGLVFTIVNTGTEPLRDVVVTDTVTQGNAKVSSMQCTFPGNSAPTKGVQDSAGNWTVTWAETTGANPSSLFEVDTWFQCTASLSGVTGPHANVAEIKAIGAESGLPIADKPFTPGGPAGTDNPYHATAKPKPLPNTGAGPVQEMLVIGFLLILAGAGVLTLRRRRATTA